MTDLLIDFFVKALVIVAALSIPALIFAAFWFDNGDLLLWLAVPIIFFMAG